MIDIINLWKKFDNGKNVTDALKNVNIHIDKGDIFGIIGMSGAGKSTLLRCLSMLEKPTEGEIIIDGTKTAKLKNSQMQKIRKEMGVVFQGYNLLMQRNVFDNIAFPLKINKANKEEITARVEALLKLVQLEDKALSYPCELSGGQKQRVAIARALATNPKVLLCDEPTSALDPLTTKQVLKLLKDISQNLDVTVVIITHEINVVRAICNKMAVIDNGEVAESGATKDIFENPKGEITKLLLDWSVE
ncbi:MAG: methionine ABC transporter ATP-binding protein [Oscillospiraceae bacterium]